MPIPTGSNDLYFATGIDNTGLMRGSQQAIGIIRGMTSQITKADVFAGLAAGAAIAFAKASDAVKDFAIEYEHSMKEVQTISAAVQGNFDGYADAIVRMSTEVPQSANELAKAYYQIVSAGYDGAEGLRLLETSAKGAVGGVSDVATVADGITTVMNAWKLSAAQAGEVSDTFFNTVKLGKTTISELASNIAQVAPLAAAYGVSFEQIASATATLTKQGTSTSMAMTQLRQALIAVNEQLGQGWSESYTLQEAFDLVAEKASSAGVDIKELTGRVEGALAIMATTGQNARGAAEDLETYAKAVGASSDAFNIMIEDSVNQSQLLKNNLLAALKPLGDFFAGKGTDFAKTMNEAFASGRIEEFTKYLAIATTALVAYKVTTKAAAVSKISFMRAIVRTRKALQAFNVVAKANPIGLVVTAITAAATAFLLFRQRAAEASKEFREFTAESARQKIEMEGLFRILGKTAKGTDAHKEALERINEKYGDYLPNLLSEKSTLEDIKTAHEEAQKAMENRLTSAAMTEALESATKEAINAQAGIKGKLLEGLADRLGDEAAGLAVNNFDVLVGKFKELDEAYKKLMSEGNTAEAGRKWAELQKGVREFVDTFTGGKDYNLVFNLAEQMVIEQGNLEAKAQEIRDLYKGFFTDDNLFGGTSGFFNGGGPGGKGGFQILNVEDLEKQLDAAKKAFQELARLRAAGLEGESGDQYDVFTQYGDSFDEYLAYMKGQYREFGAQLKIINLELSEGIIEANRKIQEWYKDMADEAKDEWDEAYQSMAKNLDKLTSQIEKDIQISVNKESFDEVDKVFRFLGKTFEFKQSEIEGLERDMNYFGQTMGKLSGVIGKFSDETGQAVASMGQIVSNAGAIANYIATGDTLTLINGIIGIVDGLVDFFNEIAGKKAAAQAEQMAQQAERISYAVDRINKSLQDQYYYIQRINGVPVFKDAEQSIDRMRDGIDSLVASLNNVDITIDLPGSDIVPTLDTSNWDLADYYDALRKWGSIMNDEVRDQIQSTLDQIYDYEKAIEEMELQIKIDLVGFDINTLVDDVMGMFQEMERGAHDFGATFEEIMQKSLLNSFQQTHVARIMQEFYDELYAAMESPAKRADARNSYGNIDPGEYEDLEASWQAKSEALQNQYEFMLRFMENMGMDISNLTGAGGEDPNSLSGAIRRSLTEETGTILAGRMNTIMLDTRAMAEGMQLMTSHLERIEANTYHNRHLDYIRADIADIKRQFT